MHCPIQNKFQKNGQIACGTFSRSFTNYGILDKLGGLSEKFKFKLTQNWATIPLPTDIDENVILHLCTKRGNKKVSGVPPNYFFYGPV